MSAPPMELASGYRRGANADPGGWDRVRILTSLMYEVQSIFEMNSGLFAVIAQCRASVVNRQARSIPAGGGGKRVVRLVYVPLFFFFSQLVEHGFEAPAALVRLQESTLDGMALVVQSAERSPRRQAAGSSPARRIGFGSDNSSGRVPVFQTGDVGSRPAHCIGVSLVETLTPALSRRTGRGGKGKQSSP